MNTTEEDYGQLMATAHQEHELKPNVDDSISLPGAYQIQSRMIELLNSPFAGYKAVLSTAQAQAAFKVNEPLLGALLENSAIHGEHDLSQMVVPLIEVEMGFELGVDVTAPISPQEFTETFCQIRIAIDLAEVGYVDKASAVDLVCGNSAAGGFIKGPIIRTEEPNNIQVTLAKDGNVINQATSGDIGDQIALAVWIVNKALSLNYPIKQGMLVMTGALGKILVAEPGRYTANYEVDGQLLADLVVDLKK